MIMPLPWAYSAIAAVLIASHTAAYFNGREAVQGEFDEYQTAVAIAQTQLQNDVEAARRASDKINQDVADGWAAALGSVRADHASRLRNVAASCAHPVRSAAVATGKPDAAAADAGSDSAAPPANYEQVCERLEADCAVTTGQLIWLQAWAKRQAEGAE
jgi:hypothetical protein